MGNVMSRFRSRVTRIAAIVATSAVFAGGAVFIGSSAASAADLPSPAPVLQRDENVATADPIPTVQIDNGYVWTQTTIGTTVYAAGQFANARAALAAPGTQLTPRTNILAFDINTGALKPFAPSVNGVEDDHRNPWISLAPTAAQAWWLSGGALEGGGFAVEHPVWDLWEADLTDIEGYRADFLKLFGFGAAGIDYDADTDPHVELA